MNPFDEDALTPQEEQALRDAVRSLPALSPDPAYRARVKDQFTSMRVLSESRPRPARRPLIWLGGLAAAAVLTMALLSGGGSPHWVLDMERSSAAVLVDGASLDPAEGSQALFSGAVVSNPGPGSVWVEVSSAIQCILAPGTEIRLEAEKSFFSPASLRAEILTGRLMAKTGPEFPGGGLTIDTDEAVIRITGTTFGVIKGTDSTCVCVIEGSVRAEHLGAGTVLDIPAGGRLNLYSMDKGTERLPLEPLSSQERDMTEMLDRASTP